MEIWPKNVLVIIHLFLWCGMICWPPRDSCCFFFFWLHAFFLSVFLGCVCAEKSYAAERNLCLVAIRPPHFHCLRTLHGKCADSVLASRLLDFGKPAQIVYNGQAIETELMRRALLDIRWKRRHDTRRSLAVPFIVITNRLHPRQIPFFLSVFLLSSFRFVGNWHGIDWIRSASGKKRIS